MLVLMILAALVAAQNQEPADLFAGAWSQGPFHVMRGNELQGFNPCSRPLLIQKVNAQTIHVSWATMDGEFVISRHEGAYHWTPVGGGEPRMVRLEDGRLRTAYRPGLDADWSRSSSRGRCPLPDDRLLRGEPPRQSLGCRGDATLSRERSRPVRPARRAPSRPTAPASPRVETGSPR